MAALVVFAWCVMVGLALEACGARRLEVPLGFSGSTVQVDVWGTNGVRVRRAVPGGSVENPRIQALLPDALRALQPEAEIGPLSLVSGNLRVEVDNVTGVVSLERVSDGEKLLQLVDCTFGAPLQPSPGRAATFKSVYAEFESSADEALYGFGEHETGVVNERPFFQNFQHSQLYSFSHGADVSLPVYHSSRGYVFVWNSPAFGFVNASVDGRVAWFSNSSGQLDFWVACSSAEPSQSGVPAGPGSEGGVGSLQETLFRFVEATGHATVLPASVRGLVQSKNRYRNQSQVLAVAKGYVARGIPLDMIVIDYFNWKQWGDFSFNPACWPDPGAMVQELQAMGVRLMVSMWPMLGVNGSHFRQFNESGWLVQRQGYAQPFDSFENNYCYDPFNEEAAKAWFDAVWEGYGRFGAVTPWQDASEPEHHSPDPGDWQYAAGSEAEVSMAFPREHARAFSSRAVAKGVPAEELFVLSRSSWIGSVQYSAATWSGDIDATFEELQRQVTTLQGMSLSLAGGWSLSDTPGYNGGTPGDPAFDELAARWFQFSTFTAMLRLHGVRGGGPPPTPECGATNGDNEIWAYGAATQQAMVDMVQLRNQLREYTGAISEYAAASGMPLMRPMALQFPNDPQAASKEDQFTYGPDWLVKPVTSPGLQATSIYLPRVQNATWTFWFNQTQFQGGQSITVDTTQLKFPLFQRTPTASA